MADILIPGVGVVGLDTFSSDETLVTGAGLISNSTATVVAALSGTVTASITESDIVTGNKTIILTLTGGTFVAAGTAFDAQRQAIINGLNGI